MRTLLPKRIVSLIVSPRNVPRLRWIIWKCVIVIISILRNSILANNRLLISLYYSSNTLLILTCIYRNKYEQYRLLITLLLFTNQSHQDSASPCIERLIYPFTVRVHWNSIGLTISWQLESVIVSITET